MRKESTNKRELIRKQYSPQFKDQAIARAEKYGVPQAAKELGLAEAMLYTWRAKSKLGGNCLEEQKLQGAELSRLKRENARLTEENAFLKKVATYFTKESACSTHSSSRKEARLRSRLFTGKLYPLGI